MIWLPSDAIYDFCKEHQRTVGDDIEIDDAGDGGGIWRYGAGKVPRLISPRAGAG